jgi:hypothetical protein
MIAVISTALVAIVLLGLQFFAATLHKHEETAAKAWRHRWRGDD